MWERNRVRPVGWRDPIDAAAGARDGSTDARLHEALEGAASALFVFDDEPPRWADRFADHRAVGVVTRRPRSIEATMCRPCWDVAMTPFFGLTRPRRWSRYTGPVLVRVKMKRGLRVSNHRRDLPAVFAGCLQTFPVRWVTSATAIDVMPR